MGKPYVSAIIVAAGTGSRMKAGINKQYLFLNGKPVLAHTLIAFEKCAMIDEIILVINKNDFSICEKDVIRANRLKKVKYMVEGGSSRQESMYNGIKKVHEKADIVLTHDGARPLIHQNTLLKSIEMTLEYGATIVAVPVKETIKVVNEDMEVASTPKRSELWTVQTPQTFSREILVKAHEKALEDGFVGTDDAMLVERLPFPIKIVKGHYDNIKITTPEDLIIAESIFQIVP
ncbi:2-C-methyl-D-erythritol 4-phosphate cytidylyltransferase [Alkalibacter sp. M17DMB]|nr:2-C-methyl-D-erythritol 4-phosphate cytidylyltransferase [Alkalibacter mobilis]MBF7095513.1 2-C-methyl-D-erythritol 4-phosphate cytidylyltransferase [Alkalibacter mobilis]